MIRYVNIHTLTALPFSNPNRTDTGAPKTAIYGGTVRGRLSSQSVKRAARTHFEATSGADLTQRSKFFAKHLTRRVEQLLEGADATLDQTAKDKLEKSVRSEVGKLTGGREDAKDTLIWLAEHDINALAQKIAAKASGGTLELTKTEIDEILSTTTESLTIAGFGRMLANRADLQIEAAVQVAHAFTTHQQDVDLDYFTAVDDLQASYDEPDAQGRVRGAGAGHLDMAEYHSGVFYRHFNINRDDLVTNWAPLQRGDEDVKDRLAAFIDALIRELPTGKNATSAHQTAPGYVLVTFGMRGSSHAPAFERAVRPGDGGYLDESKQALRAYADRMLRVDPEDHRIVFDLEDPDTTPLYNLVDAVARWLATNDLPDVR